LLVLGINDLLERELISLELAGSPTEPCRDDHGHVLTQLAERTAVINWRDIGWGKLRISVWWDYAHDRHPQAYLFGTAGERFNMTKPLCNPQHRHKFVGATATGWLERATSKLFSTVYWCRTRRSHEPGARTD
jgi:hypothetical protein